MTRRCDPAMTARFCQGHLEGAEREAAAAHLAACPECQQLADRLAAAAAPEAENGEQMDALFERMREWRFRSLEPLERQRVRLRVAESLAPYLGVAATEAVIRRAATDDLLLAAAEPALALFIGAPAAAAVITRVVDSVLTGAS